MDKETIIPNCPLDEHPCRDILRKHTHSAPVAPFALTQLRNFCLRQKTEFPRFVRVCSGQPDRLLK